MNPPALVLLALVAGCAARVPVPEVVKVPVPVPCRVEVPPRPATATDAALAALDDYGMVLTLAADRRALLGHTEALEGALAACR